MKKANSIASELAERLEIPGEALGEGKLSVVGAHRALIENHRGLLTCTEELISLRFGQGRLSLRGAALRIEAMNERELLLVGRISRVEWEE